MSKKSNFLAVCLRGSGQVFFMENQVTGAFFLAAIAYASYVSTQWAIAIGAVVGLVVATLTANWLQCDQKSIDAGLFGFNGILVGVALPTFVADSAALWFLLVFGAAASTVITSAVASTLTKTWAIPGSTGPFVLTGWLLAACAYSFGGLELISEKPELGTDYLQGLVTIPSAPELLEIFFRNIAQVFLLGSAISGVLVLIGIFMASVPAGIAAALGSLIAMVVAIGMKANPIEVSQGLYGFSPVLTAIAVGVVFLQPSWRVAVYAGLATVVTVFVQGALDIIMLPDGLPSFTAPYVLTMYLFIAPKKMMAPHPHSHIQSDHLLEKS
ncbi:urea transporter [Lampropedia aestuarii]|uniref:Urea transporter n=1 Tax=Lampropedia aestuarii TaxID=2562762 RepID=A0A4S5BNK8_9BURK|nr:urea transporter [Lampropedia aestuarii]THJ34257.1 urea transporter [Lampropedia aestuarii]